MNFLSSKSLTSLIPKLRFSSIKSLVYQNYGEPADVLRIVEKKMVPLSDKQVLVKQLASPIHNSAINMIQGVYGIKMPLPAIAGNEGIGEVLEIGASVKNLKVGDRVSTIRQEIGTWTSHIICEPEELITIPKELDSFAAAISFTNPGSALLMLEKIVELNEGDFVVQNASTSAVGIYVIQICKILGFRSINVFRDRETRESNEETKKFLFDHGAFQVFTQTEFDLLLKEKKIPLSKLALNCVGGKSSVSLLKSLQTDGSMVSYGAMSKQPTPLPVSPLIFKNISIRGFWFQRFLLKNGYNSQAAIDIRNKLNSWFVEGKLVPSPYEKYSLENFQAAFNDTEYKKNSIGFKKIFDLQ